MSWQFALAMDSYRLNSEDRAALIESPFGLVFLIADGVGGRAGGGSAAEYFLQGTLDWAKSLTRSPSVRELQVFLRKLDVRMTKSPHLGETTALLLVTSENHIAGVAIGDSEAWWITEEGCSVLTGHGYVKPWLGSGMARIHSIAHKCEDGILLLATDGLFKYADRSKLCEIARRSSVENGPRELIEAVRPVSGTLPDDVAVILARPNASQ